MAGRGGLTFWIGAKGSLIVMVAFMCINQMEVRELPVQIFQERKSKCKGPEVTST